MAITIVVHPHSFDKGSIKENLLEFLKSTQLSTYYLPDGNKKPYGKDLYTGKLEPGTSRSLKKPAEPL